MPDIAELRTTFTADDSDFQSTYKRVSAALSLFARAENDSAGASDASGRGMQRLGSDLRSLGAGYQLLTSSGRASREMLRLEGQGLRLMTAQAVEALGVIGRVTVALQKQAVAASEAARAEGQLASGKVNGPESGKESKGYFSTLLEGFHKVAEVLDDIEKTKKGVETVSGAIETLKSAALRSIPALKSLTGETAALNTADGSAVAVVASVTSALEANAAASEGATASFAAETASAKALAVSLLEETSAVEGAIGVTVQLATVQTAEAAAAANGGRANALFAASFSSYTAACVTAQSATVALIGRIGAMIVLAAKAISVLGLLAIAKDDSSSYPGGSENAFALHRDIAYFREHKGSDAAAAEYGASVEWRRKAFRQQAIQENPMQNDKPGTAKVYEQLVNKRADQLMDSWKSEMFADPYIKETDEQYQNLHNMHQMMAKKYAPGVLPAASEYGAGAFAGVSRGDRMGRGERTAETDSKKTQDDWPTKRDEAIKAAVLAQGPLKLTNDQMKELHVTSKQLNPDLESTGMIYDYLAGHLDGLSKAHARQLIQIKLSEEAGKAYTKSLEDQQKLLDDIESKRCETEVMKLPENDYADRISMDNFGVMASDLTNKDRKGYDPGQADYVSKVAGYEQKQTNMRESAGNEKDRLRGIGDEFQQQLDANLKWGIEDSAQKYDYAKAMQRISAATSRAQVRGTPNERQDFIDSGLAEYKEKKDSYKDNEHLNGMAKALGDQFDAQQQAGYVKDYQDAMKGLNAELAKYSRQSRQAQIAAIALDGDQRKMSDSQAELVLALRENVDKLKEWADQVKEISKDLAGTVTRIMDKIFIEGSHHLQKNVTQAVNSMIRGMASKFIGQQSEKGFDSLFGMLKPKTKSAGQPDDPFHFTAADLLGSAKSAAGDFGKDAALQTNTSALYQLTQALLNVSGIGGSMDAPGSAGGGGFNLLSLLGFGGGGGGTVVGPGSTGSIGSGIGYVPTGGIGSSVGVTPVNGVVSPNSARPHGTDSSYGTVNVHIHSPIQTGDAIRHARAVVKATDMRKARYA